jgi:hypothetical protein
MGTYYSTLGISSGDIGGAIAEGILHDIRVNGLGLQGFPQIAVARHTGGGFEIMLRFGDAESRFVVTDDEAKRAVRLMKSSQGHDRIIFDRVQQAAAEVESKSR